MRRRAGRLVAELHDRAELVLDLLEPLDHGTDISEMIFGNCLQVSAGAHPVGIERDEFADGIKRQADGARSGDGLESPLVIRAVGAVAVRKTLGWRDDAAALVVADRFGRQTDPLGEFTDLHSVLDLPTTATFTVDSMSDQTSSTGPLRYTAWAAASVALGLAGYIGYVVYPRFDLPAGAGAGLLVFAAAAGVASFFSPCSFPLLVSMLARPLAAPDDSDPRRRPFGRALVYATALSVGAAMFLALLGGVLSLGAGSVVEDVTFTSTAGRVLRVVVGAALIVFGLVQTGRIPVDLRRFEPALHGLLGHQARLRRRRPFRGFVLFGFVYLLAGFG